VLQTVVHEQCHLWQYINSTPGNRPRAGYHNEQWANQMESIGLMPSHTGAKGGKRTGQKMSDYPLSDGAFIKAAEALVNETNFALKWIDLIPAANEPCQQRVELSSLKTQIADKSVVELSTVLRDVFPNIIQTERSPAALKSVRSKTKYSCSKCGSNIWGRPGLKVICGSCKKQFKASSITN